ncbi:IS3 family transposase [Paenibacillus athensensis]|uniref:Integrase catalytic domain-containing protein n=1 Tax=Paenibacillus athensensis TaxID=1967502 RepID=A0A4Y8QAT9_9BACL|nr:IS3 family transposase [Paenibacillus athensensis]
MNTQPHAEAQRSIFEYIEVFYNNARIHSSIGYQTPTEFLSFDQRFKNYVKYKFDEVLLKRYNQG